MLDTVASINRSGGQGVGVRGAVHVSLELCCCTDRSGQRYQLCCCMLLFHALRASRVTQAVMLDTVASINRSGLKSAETGGKA